MNGVNKNKKNLFFKLLAFTVFILTLILMRVIEPGFLSHSGGIGTLDMRFGYDSDAVYQLFMALGAEGRIIYLKLLLIDFIFIASFVFVLNYILKGVMGKELLNSRGHAFLYISGLRGLLDAVENIIILILMISFPKEFPWLATISSAATMLKFIVLGLWMAAVPVSLVLRRRMVKNRKCERSI